MIEAFCIMFTVAFATGFIISRVARLLKRSPDGVPTEGASGTADTEARKAAGGSAFSLHQWAEQQLEIAEREWHEFVDKVPEEIRDQMRQDAVLRTVFINGWALGCRHVAESERYYQRKSQ